MKLKILFTLFVVLSQFVVLLKFTLVDPNTTVVLTNYVNVDSLSWMFSPLFTRVSRNKRLWGETTRNRVDGFISHTTSGVKVRYFSTPHSLSLVKVVPIIKYANIDVQRLQIIKENKGKSGVYRFTNIVNGACYIGSSTNLAVRFRNYFNISYLSRVKMVIAKALLKYGYSNFTLEILEYCDSSMSISREQYYIDLLKPNYNILKRAGSSFGYKHSETSLKLMSDASKSRNESEEVLKFKKEIMLGRKLSKSHLEGMIINNPFRVPIILSNIETGENKEFTSITRAALFLGVDMTTVKRYLVTNKPYKGYMITKATSNLDTYSASSLTNSKQAVELINCETGITQQFPTMKAAYQFLGISYRRLSNYLENNKSSSTNGQVSTIKGYIISKLDSVEQNCKAVEVTNIQTNEVINYSSLSLAGEALGISPASISTYFNRKRTTPYRGIYLFKKV